MALYRIFRAIQGLERAIQALDRRIARGTGTDSFFRVEYRGTLRYSQKKNLSTAVLAIQKKSTAFQERERNSVPAHPCF